MNPLARTIDEVQELLARSSLKYDLCEGDGLCKKKSISNSC